MPTLLEAALAYAARGWPVLPVAPNKTPLTAHGVKDASRDPVILRLMFSPSATVPEPFGLAVATGGDGPDVLDLDSRDIPLATYPRTYTVQTPHGYHLYFQRGAPGNRVRIRANTDIRSTGGYVVAPPTPGYRVDIDGDLAPWPHIQEEPQPNRYNVGPGIMEGGRDDALYRYACWLQGRGVSDDELAKLVVARNATYLPPLTESEVQKKISQALKMPKGSILPLKTIDLMDVKEEPLAWALQPWILDSAATSLEGDGSVGKSLLAMRWCAAMSKAGRHCLYASAEEIAATMLKPRALAAGVEPTRISFIEKQNTFHLPDSLDALEAVIQSKQTRFLVLDPLTSFFSPSLNMNNHQAARQVMEGLNNLAERNHCAVLVIRHWNKTVDSPLSSRGMGSKDLGNLVRSQLGVINHPERDNAFLLFGIKTNFADPVTVSFDKGPDAQGRWYCGNERAEDYWTKERIEHHVRHPDSDQLGR